MKKKRKNENRKYLDFIETLSKSSPSPKSKQDFKIRCQAEASSKFGIEHKK